MDLHRQQSSPPTAPDPSVLSSVLPVFLKPADFQAAGPRCQPLRIGFQLQLALAAMLKQQTTKYSRPYSAERESLTLLNVTRLPDGQTELALKIEKFPVLGYSAGQVTGQLSLRSDGQWLHYPTPEGSQLIFDCWDVRIHGSAEAAGSGARPISIFYRGEGDRARADHSAIEFLRQPKYMSSTTWGVRVVDVPVPIEVGFRLSESKWFPPLARGLCRREQLEAQRATGTSFILGAEVPQSGETLLSLTHLAGNLHLANASTSLSIAADGSVQSNRRYPSACFADLPIPMKIRSVNPLRVQDLAAGREREGAEVVLSPFGDLLMQSRAKNVVSYTDDLGGIHFRAKLPESRPGDVIDRLFHEMANPGAYAHMLVAGLDSVVGAPVECMFTHTGAAGATYAHSDAGVAELVKRHWLYRSAHWLRSQCPGLADELQCVEFDARASIPYTDPNDPSIKEIAGWGSRYQPKIGLAVRGLTIDTLIHELAHCREGRLTNSAGQRAFLRRWIQASGGLSGYAETPADLPIHGASRAWSSLVRLVASNLKRADGAISEYGAKNPYEDVAVFATRLILDPGNVAWNRSQTTARARRAFDTKIQLLVEFGFITDAQARRATEPLPAASGS